MGKFVRSWALARASWGVLRQDPKLLVFPILSFACWATLAAIFFAPSFQHIRSHEPILLPTEPRSLAALFLLSVVFHFVGFFFNTALVGAAMIRLDGGKPTLAAGLRIAGDRMGAIFAYAVLAATVGFAIKFLEERLPFLGRMVVSALGASWTVATFLVVPVLAAQNVGPLSAIRQSGAMLRRTWGETLIGNGGIGAGLLIMAAIPVAGCIVGGAALWATSRVAALTLYFTAGGLVAATILISAALDAIFAAGLYRYAMTGRVPGGFDADLIGDSFRAR